MKLKRFVSVVMTLLLCFSAVPAAVSAESAGTAALANLLTDDTVYQPFSGTITAERANIAIKKYGNVEFEHDETTLEMQEGNIYDHGKSCRECQIQSRQEDSEDHDQVEKKNASGKVCFSSHTCIV